MGILISVFISCEKESSKQSDQISDSQMVLKGFQWPTIIFGTHSKPCGSGAGCYCDGDKGICLLINPKSVNIEGNLNDVPLGTNEGIAEVMILDSKTIKIKMLRDDSWSDTTQHIFHVYDDVNLTNIFGSGTITIKKGDYPISYVENSLGDIVLDIQ
ncbi:hypothetical protein DSECCO2_508000 [anaerobic digester metagenome]